MASVGAGTALLLTGEALVAVGEAGGEVVGSAERGRKVEGRRVVSIVRCGRTGWVLGVIGRDGEEDD